MNSAEQTVTWLITLGVLHSPKKRVSDPGAFLQRSLRDGLVLCRLLDRLLPGSLETAKVFQEPKAEAECVSNIREFLKGVSHLRLELFEPHDLYKGQNFDCVLNTLVALNKATADIEVSGEPGGTRRSTHRNKSVDSASVPRSSSTTSRPPQRQSKSLEMTESGGGMVVRAKFTFQRTNEDELSFEKGDVITVTRVEHGGWWEGAFNGHTGWFPSNYVRELKASDRPTSPKAVGSKGGAKPPESPPAAKGYYDVVVKNIVETEQEYSKELHCLLATFLRPLQASDKLPPADVALLLGNLEVIASFQQSLVHSLEECAKLPEAQQHVGSCFMSLRSQMETLYLEYCANHPWAVKVLQDNREMLGEFMESKGANSPGILMLTTSLSKPFMRLDRYPTLLKELERHIEDTHPDKTDIQISMTAFKGLSAQCTDMRKRKELELQMVTETIQGWEGEGIRSLGGVLFVSHALVQCAGSDERSERYLLLFPTVLLMLSASPRMSSFIYQGKLPLTGMTVTKLEDTEIVRNAFEITGSMIERIVVSCQSPQDAQQWIEHLHRQTKGPAATCSTPGAKTAPSHNLPSPPPSHACKTSDSGPKSPALNPGYHTLPLAGAHGGHGGHGGGALSAVSRAPLEPPRLAKPWSLSCLRPAPPLRPSAALIYKEDLSKSPKAVKKLLSSRKTRKPSDDDPTLRKSTAVALEEDSQILKVIEAYCTSAKTRQTLNSICPREATPQLLLPEEEKIIMEEMSGNGQTVIEEKSLVDTVYALRDQVQELKQESQRLRVTLEEESRARQDLQKLLLRHLKPSGGEAVWDEGST